MYAKRRVSEDLLISTDRVSIFVETMCFLRVSLMRGCVERVCLLRGCVERVCFERVC